MSAKIISQKKFSKLVASTGVLSQPPGALTRLSNLLFTQRGSLQICDGSAALPINPLFPAATARALLPFTKANSTTGIGQYPPILARIMQLVAPTLVGVADVAGTTATGGSNPNPFGYYQFAVVAVDANGGTTSISWTPPPGSTNAWTTIDATGGAFNTVTLTWQNLGTAQGYQIWYLGHGRFGVPSPFAGIQGYLLGTVAAGVTTFTTAAGALPAPNTTAPWLNTTQPVFLNDVIYEAGQGYFTPTPGGYPPSDANHNLFPAPSPQPVSLQIGDPRFNAANVLPGYSPYGGLPGQVCPIPILIQFAGKVIAILGNGLPPVAYDPSTDLEIAPPAPTLLTNTFQDAFPAWQSNVDWLAGAQITDGAGNFYTATQGGVSGATSPTWNTAFGAETSDGSIIWTSQGPITNSIAPIGAAHAVAYAGSLWLANTWPTTTQYPIWAASTAFAMNVQIVVAQYQTWVASKAFALGVQILVSNARPGWIASHTFNADTVIYVVDGSGNTWSFTCASFISGTTGATPPAWNFVKNSFTTDNTATWYCNGQVPTLSNAYYVFTVQVAGNTGATAPTWNFTVGATTTDNTITWICSSAQSSTYNQIYWLFSAQIAGLTGIVVPLWNFTLGATNTDGSVTWVNLGQIAAALSAGIDGPSCLKMSDSNNPNAWNPVNTAFIGRDDGTQITGLCPFTIAALGISPTGSLCIFKEYTTYQFIGIFGTTTFEIQPAQTNLGCIAPRSIQFLPGFGVVRFSHLGFAVFDGINDRLISEDIRPYLFGGVDVEASLTPVDPSYLYLSQSAQTVTPPMYLCAMPLLGASGALTRLFCYDLVMKAWAVIDLPWAITSMATVASGEGYPLVLAGKSDGTIQRLQADDANWDQGDTNQSTVQWSFRTPDVFGEGATQRLFYEQATITGYGNPSMVQSIIAQLWLDGTNLGQQGIDLVPQGDDTFVARVSIFRNGQRAHLDISGNNGGAGGVIDSVDWAVVPKSALARRVIS